MGLTTRALTAALMSVAGLAASVAGGCASITGAAPGDAAFAGDDKEKAKKSVEPADVYVGDSKKWDKPAEVDADKIYAKIDEYKQVLDDGLKPGDAKYEILMSKATKRFCGAVKKAAKDGGYDLVAKIGSVKGVATPPDITADAIKAL